MNSLENAFTTIDGWTVFCVFDLITLVWLLRAGGLVSAGKTDDTTWETWQEQLNRRQTRIVVSLFIYLILALLMLLALWRLEAVRSSDAWWAVEIALGVSLAFILYLWYRHRGLSHVLAQGSVPPSDPSAYNRYEKIAKDGWQTALAFILPGLVIFALLLFARLAFLLPNEDATRPLDLPSRRVVEADVTVSELAVNLKDELYCKKGDQRRPECDPAQLADAIIAFNSGEGGVLIGKSESFTVTQGTTILLPPQDLMADTYLVEAGDTLAKIAACETPTLKERKDECKKTTVNDIIRANVARLELESLDDFAIVAGQRIVRPPGATAVIAILRRPVEISAFGLIVGTVMCLLILVAVGFLGGTRRNLLIAPFVSARGTTLSVSKFQMWLWVLIFIFAYTTVSIIRIAAGQFAPLDLEKFPTALVVLMGLSVGTYTTARLIVMRQENIAALTQAEIETPSLATLVQDDSGRTDITRFQLFAFTLLGVGLYAFRLVTTVQRMPYETLTVPDVDPVIVALILASQATYLAKRGNPTPTPHVSRLFLMTDQGGKQQVLITGRNLGGYQATPDIKISVDGSDDVAITALSQDSNDKALYATTLTGTLPPGNKATVKMKLNGVDHPLRDIAVEKDVKIEIAEIVPPSQPAQAEQEFTLKGTFIDGAVTQVTVLGKKADQTDDHRPAVVQRIARDEIGVKVDLTHMTPGKWQVKVKQLNLETITDQKDFCVGERPAVEQLTTGGKKIGEPLPNSGVVPLMVVGKHFQSDTQLRLQKVVKTDDGYMADPGKSITLVQGSLHHDDETLMRADFDVTGKPDNSVWAVVASVNGWDSDHSALTTPVITLSSVKAQPRLDSAVIEGEKQLRLTGSNLIAPVIVVENTLDGTRIDLVGSPTVVNAIQITCTLATTPPPGKYRVTVRTQVGLPASSSLLSATTTFSYPPLVIDRLEPATGTTDQTTALITIQGAAGSNFGPRMPLEVRLQEPGIDLKDTPDKIQHIVATPLNVDKHQIRVEVDLSTLASGAKTSTKGAFSVWDVYVQAHDGREVKKEAAFTLTVPKPNLEKAQATVHDGKVTLTISGSGFLDTPYVRLSQNNIPQPLLKGSKQPDGSLKVELDHALTGSWKVGVSNDGQTWSDELDVNFAKSPSTPLTLSPAAASTTFGGAPVTLTLQPPDAEVKWSVSPAAEQARFDASSRIYTPPTSGDQDLIVTVEAVGTRPAGQTSAMITVKPGTTSG